MSLRPHTRTKAKILMTSTTVEREPRPNPYARQYAHFLEATKDHVLTVYLDDGLNRRMRVGSPSTSMYAFDVSTWFNHLATTGDIADGFTFRRDADMIDFFDLGSRNRRYHDDGAPSIDLRYWGEKRVNGQEIRSYDAGVFIRRLTEALEEHDELGLEAQKLYETIESVVRRVAKRNDIDFDTLAAATRVPGSPVLANIVLDESDDEEMDWFGEALPEQSPALRRTILIEDARFYSDSEPSAQEWLQEHQEIVGDDAYYEWNLRDYTVSFLYTCWAIDLTIRLWRAYEQTPEAIAHRAAVKDTIAISDEALAAVLLFAERGLTRELGATDARHHYFEHELEEMNARFENAQSGLAALRTLEKARAASKAKQLVEAG